ncbi:YjcQ protein [Clostridium saccharobutylicum]|uniref:YjcQ family protein n=1 Tax=Clostridium saccharobutylicum TaxID=169679 RepID=UPI000983ADA2|nr:YjcQ family protein [Clostridium saccharobutylicum]AQS09670.1 YjcQ protein [Clostridium saccharobutylicum]MBC2436935.1 hypothetical protein [Clostridium saccharobutylicum]NSB89286.1 hypothetical protein [Clostridium saccharobutylicum]NYC27940.1 hypothetical protein [Clostridium saccharobutylicum]OOM17135.1 YjcQ protein [Clostridium saccharobutylicum]
MNQLKTIYNILSSLEEGNKLELNEELTKENMVKSIKIMVNEGLVTLKTKKCYVNQEPNEIYDYDNLEITMKGLQYRKENSKLAKAYKVVKDISSVVK